MNQKVNLLVRYALLFVIGLANLLAGSALLYNIFAPLTLYPSYWLFNLLYGARLVSATVFFFKGYYIELIPACIAGSAYYLLLILNLTTKMEIKKRIYNLIYIIGVFLIANILRIFIFGILLVNGYQYFDVAHLATWYVGSTILVILIWFSGVRIFKIKNIPVYEDIVLLIKNLRSARKNALH